ncbi:SubName: Full=Uncharacterized protein {ECO:0000313/EMBL:CCA70237.1} [Serendipita indica DSM 11827]|nr:SubName: Full=Uncharacterized protein {ECO:0000313/EMBL:CCA70237.1} [Serendipita indica DSM 11827]
MPSKPLRHRAMRGKEALNLLGAWNTGEMSKLVIIDDSHPAITYSSGSWAGAVTTTHNEYNSTLHSAVATGATIKYQFRGTGIFVYGTLTQPVTNGYPESTFQIDNNRVSNWNLTGMVIDNATTYSHVVLFKSAQYNYGDHTISINVGQFDATTTGRFNFDYFVVTGATEEDARNAGGLVIVDDKDTAIGYEGNWFATGSKAEYQWSAHRSPAASNTGTATFSFNGTSVSVYATLDGIYPSNPIASFVVDPGSANEVQGTVVIPGSAPKKYHSPILSVSGLSEGSHTLVVTSLSDQTTSWWLDYILYGSPSSGSVVNSNGSNGTATSSNQAIGQTQSNGPSKAAIAGGVIGGVVACLLVIFFLFYYLRRRGRRNDRVEIIDQYRGPIDEKPLAMPTEVATSPPTTSTAAMVASTHTSTPLLYIPPTKGQSPHPTPVERPAVPRPSMTETNHLQDSNTLAFTSSSNLQSIPDNASSAREESQPPRVRELDGGIRLEWTDQDGAHDTLPPSYSNYQS